MVRSFSIVFLGLITILSFSFSNGTGNNKNNIPLKITWTDSLTGDFTFKDQWSYPECVYRNQYGQLSCDGICPEATYAMKEKGGRIIQDSIASFYKLVDTSHCYHTLKSEARVYEWGGTDFITFKQMPDGKIKGQSVNTIGTHSSLCIEIDNDTCLAWIDFNSITDLYPNPYYFYLTEGSIQIDRNYWQKGIIKCTFNFNFENTIEPGTPLFWKGKIFSTISK